MGSKILVVFKVFPEGPDEVSAVKAGVKAVKAGEFKDMKAEPLAFGLEIIKVAYIIPDKTDGAMEALEQAVRKASEIQSEAVLLSPACASFDMFRDYRHRGEVFAAAVKALKA